MQRFTENNQSYGRARYVVAEMAPAFISSLWFLTVIIGLLVLLAATATPQAAQALHPGWPRTIRSDEIRIDVYQPQVDGWENGKLEDRTAIAITEKDTGQSTYGTAWLSARTSMDEDQRIVTLYDVHVKKVVFPSAGSKEAEYIASTTSALEQWNTTIALDRLLADIAITQNEQKATGDPLSNAPPRIFIRENPAVLILLDGQPVLQKVPGSKLMRVVNTPALMVLDPDANRYFLRGDGYWMTAAGVSEPWNRAVDAPGSLATLLDASEQAPVPAGEGGVVPEVIVSTEPAELIQIRGEVQFSPIEGTRLLYVTNTDSDVFMSLPQQRYYVLLSGRWFNAPALDGPWEFVERGLLPQDFSRIPGGHPKSAVLASVPGTPEARDAVVAAQVPRTATVDRRKATFTAVYDGEPQFKHIAGTDMSYAVNSPNDIINARGKYYAVSDGVWFVADNPLGPWIVCDFVPPEIYSMPPTVPVYHVKYVYVYDSTPDWVYVGYTPGYFGAFIWDDLVVYGTGFYYPYWYGSYYFGWPWTWGFGFHYAYWGGGFYWRPWYPRPWYWHHHGFDHGYVHSWNRVLYNRSADRGINQAAFRRGTVYDRWRSPAVVSRQPAALRTPGRIAARPEGAASRARATGRDIYSDRTGQVYSHQNDGWYRRSGQRWEKVQPGGVQVPRAAQQQARPQATQAPSTPRFEEMQRNRQARIEGQSRVNQYQRIPPAARTTSPPPRMAAPRSSAPAPRMSAPRTSSPRMSAPRSAPAPRMSAPPSGGRRR